LLPIGVQLLAAGVYRLFGGSVPIGRLTSLEGAFSYFVAATPFMLLTEETGWRGFALPRLQVKYQALIASLIVGLLWGVWHTPLFLTPGDPRSTYPYLGFVLSAMAQSVLTTWVYNNTGGSVLLASIFHAATNGTGGYVAMGVGDVQAFWVFTVAQCVAAVIIVALAGPDRLSRSKRVDQPPVAPQVYQPQQNT
jgi:membrane protease YdiL (CAAX protease family)